MSLNLKSKLFDLNILNLCTYLLKYCRKGLEKQAIRSVFILGASVRCINDELNFYFDFYFFLQCSAINKKVWLSILALLQSTLFMYILSVLTIQHIKIGKWANRLPSALARNFVTIVRGWCKKSWQVHCWLIKVD